MTAALQSDRSLAVTIGNSTLFGILASVVQILTRVVTVPVVLAHLGLDGYGIWSIIMAIAAYMRFGSAGIKSAFQKYVAEATGSEDFDKVNRLLSTGTLALLVLSIVGLIPVVFVSTSLARAARVPEEFLGAAAGSIGVLALTMVISNIGSVYEAIVLGGHRIDLVKKCSMLQSVLEGFGIVLFLKLGYGLLAMAIIMAASELARVVWCYFASLQIAPAIQVKRSYVTRRALPELIRFAGSYQLVNVLEILYVAIAPVMVLRLFGAHSAGVLAVCERLVGAALLLQDAALLPLLSGGTLVFASRLDEKSQLLLTKAFKFSLALTLPPLTLLSLYGPTVILAWTGQKDPLFQKVVALICVAGFFRSVSLLGLVLYRATGGALMDVARQSVRIAIVLVFVLVGSRLGLLGLLAGWALAEFLGMALMLFALIRAFPNFNPRKLLLDTLKLVAGTIGVMAACALAAQSIVSLDGGERFTAFIRLLVVTGVFIAAIWPALKLTRYLSAAEGQAIFDVASQYRRKRAADSPSER